MLKISTILHCPLFLLLIFTCFSSAEEDFSLGPLIHIERDNARNASEIDLLGPFITSKKTDQRSEFGIRPLFYWLEDKERNSTEFDLLYPIATYDKREDNWSFQFLVHLLSYESAEKRSGFREKEFTLFPLIFSKRAEKKEDSYFALFPIYGKVKDKFMRDEVSFFLFPLFLESKKGETVNRSFLWPLFGYYTGGGHEGFRVWPLFGYRKAAGTGGGLPVLDEKFALWPIYVSRRMEFHGEEISSFQVFPFYSTFETPNKKQETYLWPLFNRLVDKKKGIERFDVPWPLVNFTRGEKEEDRIFPFYAREVDGKDEEGFFLWPLYRYSRITLEDHVRRRKNILLFLYSDIKEEPLIEGGRDSRRIDIWPLFSYKRDGEGNSSFHLLSILEPFLSNNEGIERNYSSFWRLYQWKKDEYGRSSHSLLWNIFRTERDEEGRTVELRPIIPLFSYRDSGDESKVYFLGGLFGYKSERDKKTIKLFFLPIDYSSGDVIDEGEGREK